MENLFTLAKYQAGHPVQLRNVPNVVVSDIEDLGNFLRVTLTVQDCEATFVYTRNGGFAGFRGNHNYDLVLNPQQ